MPGRNNESTATGSDWKQYAAGGPYNLVADSQDGASCARLVVLLAAGDLTTCKRADGTNRALTGLPSGYQHQGSTAEITPTVACIAYW